ncbi:MAG: NAD-dependent malic enzyme [Chlamydiota bacterium]
MPIKRFKKSGQEIVELENVTPKEILHDPLLNKGTGFTAEERRNLGITGLIPYHISTIEEQVKRRYANFCKQETGIAKYQLLTALQDRNETLFFRLLSEYPEEMLPYIYTPTVGDASVHYSYIYNQNRGVYISYPDIDHIDKIVKAIPKNRVDAIVVTDGARILGLGDLGVGGMAIPVGKLSLYTLFGGVHPAYTLPVLLDVGTNNLSLLNDPLYLGWHHERIDGKEYDAFIEAFVTAITKRFPHVLIQWEDFAKHHAHPILERYRDKICCFNDDIQGTAGVVMAGILSALRGTDQDLKDQRFVFFGAGSAGIGIADLIVEAMRQQGVSIDEARSKIYVLGRKGLAHNGCDWLDPLKRKFAQSKESIEGWDVEDINGITLYETVKHVKPTILIGTSTTPGSFTKEIVTEMKKHTARPIIFPLSNPTSKSEAFPDDLITWTRGQAVIATGSPFDPVSYDGKTHVIGQCNNVYIFPGVGLGTLAAKATRVTDGMFLKAAEVVSRHAPILNHPYASLFPRISALRAISKEVAIAVGQHAVDEGICQNPPSNIEKAVSEMMWEPRYAHMCQTPEKARTPKETPSLL